MKTRNTGKQWAVMVTLTCVGIIGFFLMLGGENPEGDADLATLAMCKFGGLAVIIACCLLGRLANAKGLLPESDDDDMPIRKRWED